jgi:hypothetical protein
MIVALMLATTVSAMTYNFTQDTPTLDLVGFGTVLCVVAATPIDRVLVVTSGGIVTLNATTGSTIAYVKRLNGGMPEAEGRCQLLSVLVATPWILRSALSVALILAAVRAALSSRRLCRLRIVWSMRLPSRINAASRGCCAFCQDARS